MPSAIGRSNDAPAFRTSAGARFTVIFVGGNSNPELRIALLTRSRLSRTLASGRPTIVNEGNPNDTSTSTFTAHASTPKRAAVRRQASMPARHANTGTYEGRAGVNELQRRKLADIADSAIASGVMYAGVAPGTELGPSGDGGRGGARRSRCGLLRARPAWPAAQVLPGTPAPPTRPIHRPSGPGRSPRRSTAQSAAPGRGTCHQARRARP